MRFVCCRDGAKYRKYYSFEEAVIKGWSDNGGMILPALDEIPFLDSKKLKTLSGLSYEAMCYEIMSLFITEDEIPSGDLRAIISDAFKTFGSPETVTVKRLDTNLQVLELWHGPTLAFKDLGMQILAKILSYFLERKNEHLTLLVGTSGDTGSSAIHSVLGMRNISLVVLFPKGRISEVQELQMTSAASQAENVTVVGVEGTSDDLDVPIEALFRDLDFKQRHRLGSVNSVNICRLLVQIVHYFYAYLRHDPEAHSTVDFSIPTGAGGHVTAGILGRMMGLPARKLIVATNENDIMSKVRQVQIGGDEEGLRSALRSHMARIFSKSGNVLQTTSPSMDIQVPYNVERMLFFFANGRGSLVSNWMADFGKMGQLRFTEADMERFRSLFALEGCAVTDVEVLSAIRDAHRNWEYLLDPHTAVGVVAARKKNLRKMTICMGCAHAVKFLETIKSALEVSEPGSDLLTPSDKRHPHVAKTISLLGTTFPYQTFQAGTDWEGQLRALITALRAPQ